MKVAAYAAATFTVFGAVLTLASILAQQRFADRTLERHATATAARTARSCEAPLQTGDIDALREIVRDLRAEPDVVDADILDALGRPLTISALGVHAHDRSDVLELRRPVRRGDLTVGFVKLTVSRAFLDDEIATLQARAIAVGVIFVAFAMALAIWRLRRVLLPIGELCDATQTIAGGDFDVRLPVRRDDEIGLLAESFNSMASALQATTVRRDELARTNQELDTARLDAVASARAKSEFLANMSHEIRTPMTAILGFAEILLENTRQPGNREAAQTIHANGQHLLSILDDILDLSKIEAGRMTVEQIPCSPAGLLREVAELMQVRARAKSLQLLLQIGPSTPESIETDPTRLRQVLVNLIGNALKFTETGAVTIEIGRGADDREDRVEFTVADTGIGMSEDQVARLFRPFSQGDERTTRRFGGTGLGLAISRRLVSLLGGDLTVVSSPGEGSRFVISVPVGSPDACPLLAAPRAPNRRLEPGSLPSSTDHERPLEGTRILLAEDGYDNQRLVSYLLRKLGSEVTIVDDGRAAIETATASTAADQPFDLILMDMQMPEMDGYAATAELRAQGFDRPIVALTAHAMLGDRELCLRAGCDDYATKPIQRGRLVSILRAQLGRDRDPA